MGRKEKCAIQKPRSVANAVRGFWEIKWELPGGTNLQNLARDSLGIGGEGQVAAPG